MEVLVAIIAVSFIAGWLCCYFFWKWYQSSKINDEIRRIELESVDTSFDMHRGITYLRPYRLGRGQYGSEDNLSGMSKLCIIRYSGYIEVYGAWNRNNKNQIDPFSLFIPTENINPDNLILFGEYFVRLGKELNEEIEKMLNKDKKLL